MSAVYECISAVYECISAVYECMSVWVQCMSVMYECSLWVQFMSVWVLWVQCMSVWGRLGQIASDWPKRSLMKRKWGEWEWSAQNGPISYIWYILEMSPTNPSFCISSTGNDSSRCSNKFVKAKTFFVTISLITYIINHMKFFRTKIMYLKFYISVSTKY